MLMVIGTNHKYSPIEVRERLAIPKGRLKATLAELVSNEGIRGAVILSTCNRVEVYADVEDASEGMVVGARFIAPIDNGFDKSNPYIYTYKGKEAISHLFEVAAGLDSQIIGEGQILDQLMFAWEEAKGIGASNDYLNVIFDKTIKVSFRVKRETGVSAGNISIADIILGLIDTNYGGIKDKRILIIGVGKISELIVGQLKERQARAVFIANKTFEKARQLAGIINAEVVRFGQLRERLKEADVVITATASPHYILKKEDIVEAINHKLSTINYKPFLIIDLAVPRDVDPDIKDIQGITLFNLDDLNSMVGKYLTRRIQEIPKARNIINKEVEDLSAFACECVGGSLAAARYHA